MPVLMQPGGNVIVANQQKEIIKQQNNDIKQQNELLKEIKEKNNLDDETSAKIDALLSNG